ncbi:hypothetical protein HIM_02251 [Hirsutella minnesotensis 3608]|nr:hypothetical protein HIM_02251 [Hirsutella minnesotensis 3608]
MKYGQQLEQESVPEWSLHNLDYNSLKHEIKAHTTRNQATAMAIPGQPDVTLNKFEDGLYAELDRQHNRLHLFVSSKADEISRRLEHLDCNIQRWIQKYADIDDTAISLRRRRRFAKYERELLRCGQDIFALSRFAKAQVVAFRKILKKHRKWTGSTSLTCRVNQEILSDPKSFTKRDFSSLQARYDQILEDVRQAAPRFSAPCSPSTDSQSLAEPLSPARSRVAFDPLPPAEMEPQVKYWNEYDDGSDCGGPDDEYAIYINPDEEAEFPGLAYVRAFTTVPYEKAKQWFDKRKVGDECQPLLNAEHLNQGYASTTIESEEEGYSSSDGIPHEGYSSHYALPSTNEQKMRLYREKVLLRGTIGCFLASYLLLAIGGILVWTGKRQLRVEVDVGATLGVMASLLCACIGLGMTLYRTDALRIIFRLGVWVAFIGSCLLNGMLLVLILGNGP